MQDLFVTRNKLCKSCDNVKRKRKECERCNRTGFEPVDLSGSWGPCSAFLVCGGPSIATLPSHRLAEQGVMSLGVNNAAAAVPVKAWCFSDGQGKFHDSLYRDPSIMSFVPTHKLNCHVRKRLDSGEFRYTSTKLMDCPNTYGFSRRGWWHPDTFLTSWAAQWGMGGKQTSERPYRDLCTACPHCKESGVCGHCGGDKMELCHPSFEPADPCEQCLKHKGKPTGKCKFCGGEGVVRPWTCLCTTFLGLRLLCYLGATTIYLLGVDLWRPDKERGYGFDEVGSGGSSYTKEKSMFKDIRPTLEAAGIRVFNVSPDSQCETFDYCSFDDAIADCNIERAKTLQGWYGHAGRQAARDYHKAHGFVEL